MESREYWRIGKWIRGVCEVMDGDVSEMIRNGVRMNGDRRMK